VSYLLSLEFRSNFFECLERARFYGIPIAILFTLTGTLRNVKDKMRISAIVIWTIVLSFFSFGFMIFILFANMCSWSTNETYFISKSDNSTSIVSREFGCSATDSGDPKTQTFKVTKINSHLDRVTKLDTNYINKNDWIRVNSGSQ
jgi:hypothetical protein